MKMSVGDTWKYYLQEKQIGVNLFNLVFFGYKWGYDFPIS
jgi:hypothetical protein